MFCSSRSLAASNRRLMISLCEFFSNTPFYVIRLLLLSTSLSVCLSVKATSFTALLSVSNGGRQREMKTRRGFSSFLCRSISVNRSITFLLRHQNKRDIQGVIETFVAHVEGANFRKPCTFIFQHGPLLHTDHTCPNFQLPETEISQVINLKLSA